MIAGMVKSGVDHETLLETYIHAINLVTSGRPDDLTVSIHMCRGNYKVCYPGCLQVLIFPDVRLCRAAFTSPKEVTNGLPSESSTRLMSMSST